MSGVYSGKWANVDGVSTSRNWSISEQQAPARGVASNTKFGPVRRRGVHSWTGQYSAYGARPSRMPGEIFAFEGYGAPTDGSTIGGNGLLYSGNAIVDSIAINWSWETGEMLNHVVNFSGHMALSKADGPDPGDITDPDAPPVGLTKVEWRKQGDINPHAELPNLTRATLTIQAANLAYVNSSTVVAGKVWTGRLAGIYDFQLALQQQDNERIAAGYLDIGDNLSVKLYDNAVDFWLLEWCHVRDFSGISADRETGAVIARTVNMDMNAFSDPDYGQIMLPGEVVAWWPAP